MHPLLGKLDGLTMDELLEKTNELHKKLGFARNMRNQEVINQIQLMLSTYQEEYYKRMRDEAEKAKDNPYMKDRIQVKK